MHTALRDSMITLRDHVMRSSFTSTNAGQTSSGSGGTVCSTRRRARHKQMGTAVHIPTAVPRGPAEVPFDSCVRVSRAPPEIRDGRRLVIEELCRAR